MLVRALGIEVATSSMRECGVSNMWRLIRKVQFPNKFKAPAKPIDSHGAHYEISALGQANYVLKSRFFCIHL
jgi:hypothetical protein